MRALNTGKPDQGITPRRERASATGSSDDRVRLREYKQAGRRRRSCQGVRECGCRGKVEATRAVG